MTPSNIDLALNTPEEIYDFYCQEGRLECFDDLLERGAGGQLFNHVSSENWTALLLAASMSEAVNRDLMRQLIQVSPQHIKPQDIEMIFNRVAELADVQTMALLNEKYGCISKSCQHKGFILTGHEFESHSAPFMVIMDEMAFYALSPYKQKVGYLRENSLIFCCNNAHRVALEFMLSSAPRINPKLLEEVALHACQRHNTDTLIALAGKPAIMKLINKSALINSYLNNPLQPQGREDIRHLFKSAQLKHQLERDLKKIRHPTPTRNKL